MVKVKKVVQIQDGDKVRINKARILARPDYDRLTPLYRQFVEENSGTVFTAKTIVKPDKYESGIFAFVESPAWYFWDGDLIKVGEEE